MHFFYTEVQGDFTVQSTVNFTPQHQYDQAGLYIRADADNWIKTAIEYENKDFAHLGAVVTNLGFSDWSTQQIPASIDRASYKIIRNQNDFEIYAMYRENRYEQLRIAHFHLPAKSLKVGVYACCPKRSGMTACFEKLELETN